MSPEDYLAELASWAEAEALARRDVDSILLTQRSWISLFATITSTPAGTETVGELDKRARALITDANASSSAAAFESLNQKIGALRSEWLEHVKREQHWRENWAKGDQWGNTLLQQLRDFAAWNSSAGAPGYRKFLLFFALAAFAMIGLFIGWDSGPRLAAIYACAGVFTSGVIVIAPVTFYDFVHNSSYHASWAERATNLKRSVDSWWENANKHVELGQHIGVSTHGITAMRDAIFTEVDRTTSSRSGSRGTFAQWAVVALSVMAGVATLAATSPPGPTPVTTVPPAFTTAGDPPAPRQPTTRRESSDANRSDWSYATIAAANGAPANMRDAPGSGKILRAINSGTRVKVYVATRTPYPEAHGGTSDWYSVEVVGNPAQTGWMHQNVLSLDGRDRPTATVSPATETTTEPPATSPPSGDAAVTLGTVPPDRSHVPNTAEWSAAAEIVMAKPPNPSCEVKLVREWLRISCRTPSASGGTPTTVTPTMGTGKDTFTFTATSLTSVVTPVIKGNHVEVEFAWTDSKRTAVLDWATSMAHATLAFR